MPGQPAVAVLTPALLPPTSAFVVAAEPATTQPDSDLFFGDLEGLETPQRPEAIDVELVQELVGEIQHIKGNSGVGSPEVRKYVDAWSPPEASFLQAGSTKEAALRALAEALYQRRPVLYLKGHAQPYPAQVLLRTVRKPSVGALSTAAAAAGLFKSPSNTVIVIKFDPQFGYADIIVDPFFTDAFIQQPATPTYSQLLSQLPRAFVGTAVELRRVVALLTQQSMRAYASKGAACPPWRRFDAMLARWLPKRYTDEAINHGPGSAAPAAAAAAAVPAELLHRSDSSSSSTESSSSSVNGWSFSAVSSSFSSSSSTASSAPRTVVHGFDIPTKAPAAATVAAAPAAATVAAAPAAATVAAAPAAAAVAAAPAVPAVSVAEVVVAPAAAHPAAPAAAPVASSKAAAVDSINTAVAAVSVAEVVVAPAAAHPAAPAASGKASAVDSIGIKLAAAAAAAERDSAAAASSWQLAAGRIVVEVSDEADGYLSSSSSSNDTLTFALKRIDDGAEEVEYAGDSAATGPAATAAAATAQPAAAAAAAVDPSVQLLAAYGYSSRVVKLQNPAAAAAAAAAASAAAGARVRGTRAAAAADAQPLQQRAAPLACDAGTTARSYGIKHAFDPAADDAASDERVCCGFTDLAGHKFGLEAADGFGGAAGKAEGQGALGLAAAVARIRAAVLAVDVAAAVPVGDSREVWGRKVLRLDAGSGCMQYSSARAA